jgi:hypothetical protein
MAAIGASLAKANCADELTDQGMLKNKTKYAPKPEAVTRVIEKVRAEFLEDGVVTDETLYLASFLDKSGFIRDYFSKVEKETLKKRIKEVRKSEAFASVKEVLDELEAMYAVIVVMTVAGT